MDYKFFLTAIKNIILNPAKAWDTIVSENKPVKLVRNSLFLPLIILVSVSSFIGSLIFINPELSPVYSIFVAIKNFIVLYFTIYATALILREITYPLDLGRDYNISFSIVVFSSIPLLLCLFISNIFESLLFINIVGLYSLYIFWIGTEKILNPPQYKKMPMLIATFICMIAIYVISDLVLTKLAERIYYAYFA